MSKKEIFGWSMYDFANTIFSALFVTIYFPLLVVLKGGNAFHVGLIISLSMLLAGLFVPFIGALVDLTKRKKQFLFIFTVLCCVITFFTGFFGLIVILILGLIANFFYHICLDVYDSLLVNVSNSKNIGRISGIGTAVGYAGTILAVIIAYFIGRQFGYESTTGIMLVFIATAVLFLLFSIPTFILVKHEKTKEINSKRAKQALKNVFETLRGIKKYKSVWLFLLASFLYTDGANTAIIFLFLFARDQLGLSVLQFLPLYIMMAMTAGLGALMFGYISDKVGHKQTMFGVLIMWTMVILLLYLNTSYVTFMFTGLVGGALLGGMWTLTRPILVKLAPKHKIAELFGYQGLTEKFSGVIGPFLFGAVAISFGFQQALLIVIGLFLAGGIVLAMVKE